MRTHLLETARLHVCALALILLVAAAGCGKESPTEPSANETANQAPAGDTNVTPLPAIAPVNEADAAWQALQKAAQSPTPPESWQETPPTQSEIEVWRESTLEKAEQAAALARAFHTQYPEDRRAPQAKIIERNLLDVQVRMGDTNAVERLNALEKDIATDEAIPDEQRFEARVVSLHRTVSELTDREKLAEAFTEGVRDIARDFPDSDRIYPLYLQALDLNYEVHNNAMVASLKKRLTQYSDEQIAAEPENFESYRYNVEVASIALRYGDFETTESLLAKVRAEDPPEEIKQVLTQVSDLLAKEKEKREMVGETLELQFTAMDGSEIDLADYRGRVVLLDFWATWCDPCVAGLPAVMDVYGEFHDQGFEILGISFDEDKEKLRQFLEAQDIPWPQYFDGQGWNNEIGQRFGVSVLPTMWLVDKAGKLRDLDARQNLAEKVAKYMAGP